MINIISINFLIFALFAFVFGFGFLSILITKLSGSQNGVKRGDEKPFSGCKIMNKSEASVFVKLKQHVAENWTVMAQVSYGSFLKNSTGRYFTVNSKRADFVVVSDTFDVVSVVEYHGSGHFGSGPKKREQVKKSDEVKKQALLEAGIPYLVLPARDYDGAIEVFFRELVQPRVEMSEQSL